MYVCVREYMIFAYPLSRLFLAFKCFQRPPNVRFIALALAIYISKSTEIPSYAYKYIYICIYKRCKYIGLFVRDFQLFLCAYSYIATLFTAPAAFHFAYLIPMTFAPGVKHSSSVVVCFLLLIRALTTTTSTLVIYNITSELPVNIHTSLYLLKHLQLSMLKS